MQQLQYGHREKAFPLGADFTGYRVRRGGRERGREEGREGGREREEREFIPSKDTFITDYSFNPFHTQH